MKRLGVTLLMVGMLLAPAAAYADHDYGGGYECMSHECEGGGYSGGPSGGYYEGGESGEMDQDGENNCRNFCFYGVPMPGEGQR
jgi:hypothetical protein